MAGPTAVPSVLHDDDGQFAIRNGREMPAWRSVLAVVAHPDDESFGLGAVIDALTSAGAAVHVLCFTRGEASTLNERDARPVRGQGRGTASRQRRARGGQLHAA